MSTPQIPTAEQLNTARLLRWHQAPPTFTEPEIEEGVSSRLAADPVLTQDALREFVQRAGLMLFSPRPQLTGAPAPTIVEATLGRREESPSFADQAEARTLLARLIADGSVVGLNLLGAATTTADNPDFVVAASVFPYIFTLRGDKLWKQPPSNSGVTKVSPLALNTFTLLAEQGPRTATDLVAELGKGLTEAAVLRGLSELWQHLRVLPVPQLDGAPAIWELTSTRFTKQIKAGANAGQPTALSALASLYLGQTLLATEEEIETFLSPLSSRSRVRDVLHALSAAQQLDSLVIDGKHYLHVAGELPSFAEPARSLATEGKPTPEGQTDVVLAENGTRIRSFQPRKTGTGFAARPKAFVTKTRPDRERRPFDRAASQSRPSGRPPQRERSERSGRTSQGRSGSAPSYARPWDEERSARSTSGTSRKGDRSLPANSSGHPGTSIDATLSESPSRVQRPFSREASPRGRPSFGDRARTGGGDRPAYSRRPPTRGAETRGGPRVPGAGAPQSGEGGERFALPRSDAKGQRRPGPKSAGSGTGEFRLSGPKEGGSRPRWSKPNEFKSRERTPEAERRSSPGAGRSRSDSGRPARFTADRPAGRRDAASQTRPPSRQWASGEASGSGQRSSTDRPFRRFDAPRGPKRSFAATPTGAGGSVRFTEGGAGKRPRPNGSTERPTGRFNERPPSKVGFNRKMDASKRGPGTGARDGRERGKGTSERSAPRRPVTAGGANTFDKFKGGNKPWGKRPPARKIKPVEEES